MKKTRKRCKLCGGTGFVRECIDIKYKLFVGVSCPKCKPSKYNSRHSFEKFKKYSDNHVEEHV